MTTAESGAFSSAALEEHLSLIDKLLAAVGQAAALDLSAAGRS